MTAAQVAAAPASHQRDPSRSPTETASCGGEATGETAAADPLETTGVPSIRCGQCLRKSFDRVSFAFWSIARDSGLRPIDGST